MKTRALLVLTAATAVAITLAGSAAQALPPQPIPTCSPAPDDCSAWHTTNVTVTWSTPSCPAVAITSDTSGTPVSCTASDSSGSVSTTVIVRRDASAIRPRQAGARTGQQRLVQRPARGRVRGQRLSFGHQLVHHREVRRPRLGNARVNGSCTDFAGNRGTGALELNTTPRPPPRHRSPSATRTSAAGTTARSLSASSARIRSRASTRALHRSSTRDPTRRRPRSPEPAATRRPTRARPPASSPVRLSGSRAQAREGRRRDQGSRPQVDGVDRQLLVRGPPPSRPQR